MTYRRMTLASAVVAVALVIVAMLALHRLPTGTQLPTHWNAAGEPDRFAAASTALFTPVFLIVGLSAIFAILPRIEPLQDKLDRSRSLLITAWAGLLAIVAVSELMIAATAFGLHPPATLMLVAAGLLLIAIGNMLPKSRPGFFVGIRTPWALTDEDNWVATHRLGAWTFIAGGALIVAAGLTPLAGATRHALVIATVPPVLYSFWHWRRTRTA